MPSQGVRLDRLDAFAQRHHGLVTRATAGTLGVSRAAWYRAIESGLLEQVHPNVARLWGTPPTLPQRALAAVWAVGDGAIASHRTSASLWGVERPPNEPIDVIVPSRRRMAQLPGVIIHRPRDLLDLHPIMRNKVPTTNPMRMLLDLGALDEGAVHAAMITVMSSKVASPAAIRAALQRHARSGRSGITPLRMALEAWIGEDLPPDSLLEARMAALITTYGLPPVEFHAIVATYEVDFLVIGTLVILECDGWGAHGLDRDQFEFDRIRNGELLAAGYMTTHFTWRMLTRDPDQVADRIRRVLTRWAHLK